MDTKPMLIRHRQLSMLETSEIPSRPLAPAQPVRIRATALTGERREHHRPRMESRPDQLPNKQQLADADEIAQRVKDTSRSATIEYLLNRQMNRQPKLFEGDRQPQPRLEHLAIARGSDGFFRTIDRKTKQPITRHAFETATYCTQAAAELERTFELGGMLLNPELLEHIEAIVLAAVWRERVAMEIAVA
ncbi:MAG: hypothetical protein WCA35_16175 [Kovacikia sp.]